MAFRAPLRMMSTVARQKLKIGLIPADGIGREVIPAARATIEALGSDIPKPEFVDLEAGFELFATSGEALPEDTVEYVSRRIVPLRSCERPPEPSRNATALYSVRSGTSFAVALFFKYVLISSNRSSPIKKVTGYSSPIVGLRKQLDLYANVRPVVSVRVTSFFLLLAC